VAQDPRVALEEQIQPRFHADQVVRQPLLHVLEVGDRGIEARHLELGLREIVKDDRKVALDLAIDPEQRALGFAPAMVDQPEQANPPPAARRR
jgi:hypothetical protein